MFNVIYSKCPSCNVDYFISKDLKNNKFLYECIECKLEVTFLHVQPDLYLESREDYIVFIKKYKLLNLGDLRYTIFQENKNRKHAKKIEEEQKNRLLIQKKLAKKQELKDILKSSYFSAREYWSSHLKELFTEEEFNKVITQYVIDWFKANELKIPDLEQAACIANVWDNVQVVARAGSGKTSTIINKTIFLINHCKIHPSEILILAFNKDAAEEVNKRLEKVLKQESPQAMTFHALAYGIVHPKENLIYDQLENLGKSKSVQNVIDSYIHSPKYADEFRTFMLKYFKQDWNRIILKGHNLSKKEMIEYRRSLPNIGLDGRYYKSMGEKRIADYLFEFDIPYYYEYNFSWNGINYRPDFTIKLNKNTIKGIVIEYFGIVGDPNYDKDSLDKINYWKDRKEYLFLDMYPTNADSIDSLEKFLNEPLKAFFPNMEKLSENEIWNRIKKRAVDEFSKVCSSFISRCRKLMLTPESIASLVRDKKNRNELSDLELDFLRIIWRIYRDYLESLKQKREQDFDGLMEQAIEVVKKGNLEWNRRKGSGNLGTIKYLFIDEFQDFSLLFYELISAIRKHNDYVKLFCVGDDWQAINSFAGSDLKYFNEFEEIINNSKKLYITTNYRSYQNIVQVGNRVMKKRGEPSIPNSTLEGNVLVTYLDQFNQSEYEKTFYKGDLITPALIRIINSVVEKGKKVSLLSRRNSGLPYYNSHENRRGNFHDNLLEDIRQEFSEDKRELIVSTKTVHAFKGKEEVTIILLDAIEKSFPLLHPRNAFFEILGSTPVKVIEEERRLFYVALSRARENLIIISESSKESPFLKDIKGSNLLEELDINKLNPPNKIATKYTIVVSNEGRTLGTVKIKGILKTHWYNYDSTTNSWRKNVDSEDFIINKLLEEPWVSEANDVKLDVVDEFDILVYSYLIKDGTAFDLLVKFNKS